LSGTSMSNVEVFSPDGGCEYSLSSLPLPLLGLSLGLSMTSVLACSGYDSFTRTNNLQCWNYNTVKNTWILQVRMRKASTYIYICIYTTYLRGDGWGGVTPCACPPPWPSIFSYYSFLVHHCVNRDDRHLLAHAMASDFSVKWQISLKENNWIFCYGPNSMPLSD
jgi:hypothetical protein